MNAILYARFSPRRDDQAASNESQLAECREYADRQGWRVVAEFGEERLSGDDVDRPGLWDAVHELEQAGRGVLLVWRYDRLARSVYLSECIGRAVKRAGGRIVAVNGNVNGDGPEERLQRQILQAFAEYEKEVIRARTSAAMRRHQANGRKMGRWGPYGTMVDPMDPSRLVACPEEQAAIRRIVELHTAGVGLRGIARIMNREGFPVRGARWYRPTITAILKAQGLLKSN